MYPVPFNILYSDQIIDVKAEFEGGVQIGGERLNNLRFADDIQFYSATAKKS